MFWSQFWLRLIKSVWGVILVFGVLVGLVAGTITDLGSLRRVQPARTGSRGPKYRTGKIRT